MQHQKKIDKEKNLNSINLSRSLLQENQEQLRLKLEKQAKMKEEDKKWIDLLVQKERDEKIKEEQQFVNFK